MKKLLSVLLVAVMLLSLGVTAFAADDEPVLSGDEDIEAVVDNEETDDVENAASFDVTVPVTVERTNSTVVTYSVNIAWTITPGGESATTLYHNYFYTWDPESRIYVPRETTPETVTQASDHAAHVEITITNSSNVDVDYKVEYSETNVTTGLTVSQSADSSSTGKDKGTIETVDTIEHGDVDNGKLPLDNVPPNSIDENGERKTGDTAKSETYGTDMDITVSSNFTLPTAENADTFSVCLGTYTVTIGAAGKFTDTTPETE